MKKILFFITAMLFITTMYNAQCGWQTTGNATTSNSDFLGTTTNKSFYFKSNNIFGGKIDSLASVIFYKQLKVSGTSVFNPNALLEVDELLLVWKSGNNLSFYASDINGNYNNTALSIEDANKEITYTASLRHKFNSGQGGVFDIGCDIIKIKSTTNTSIGTGHCLRELRL